jgi:hypothetical protein
MGHIDVLAKVGTGTESVPESYISVIGHNFFSRAQRQRTNLTLSKDN